MLFFNYFFSKFWLVSSLILIFIIYVGDFLYKITNLNFFILNFKTLILRFFLIEFLENLYFLYYLDFNCKSNTGLNIIGYLIDTSYLTLYTVFNVNNFSLLFILLTNIIIILSILWSWNFNWNIKNLFFFYFCIFY